jgi:hypothetical protein
MRRGADGRGDVLDIVVHKDVVLSEVRVLDIVDSDHLPIVFCILDHVKARGIFDPVKKFRDWERFKSHASALVSPRIEINYVQKLIKQIAILQPL